MNDKSFIGKWGVLMFAFVCFAATTVTAQKIGHMNSQAFFAEMPATISAKNSMEEYSKQLNDDFVNREKKLQEKVASAEKKYTEGNMTQNELETVRAEIQKQSTELEKTRSQFQTQLIEKEETLMKPLVEKFTKAIKEVAAENGYNFILDSAALLYADDTDDVTSLVKAKLGL